MIAPARLPLGLAALARPTILTSMPALQPALSHLALASRNSVPAAALHPTRCLATMAAGTGSAMGDVDRKEIAYLGDLHLVQPLPVRHEFTDHKMSSKELEEWKIGVGYHRLPESIGDRLAFAMVKLLRLPTDLFFRKKYLHRAVLLETVAAIPGLVAGSLRHLTSLRRMRHDGGWITHLLHEAENERMHLMTWTKMFQPKAWERLLVLSVQGVFWNLYFVVYLLFPKIAHRFVGYLEEEAVVSYTHFLHQIDTGAIPNTPAPPIAVEYWNLKPEATLRDVVLAVRADEAAHRDVNHHLADRLVAHTEDLRVQFQPKLGIVENGGNGRGPSADAEGMIPRIDIKRVA